MPDPKTPATPAAKSITSIVDGLAADQPEVSEHAINAKQQQDQETARDNAVDKLGRVFNPEFHQVDGDGAPAIANNGQLKIRAGRRDGSKNKKTKATKSNLARNQTRAATQSAEQQAAAELAAEQKKYQAGQTVGRSTAAAVFMLGQVIGGQEWLPMKSAEHGIDEQATLETAFAEYFIAKGIDDVPPGLALTIALTAYVLPRLSMPQTQARLAVAVHWTKGKINGARAHPGHDGKRQNDAGQKADQILPGKGDRNAGPRSVS